MDIPAERSVLVVEDYDDVRELCVVLLESEGFRALGVEDGEAALRLLEAAPTVVCVIVLDLRLPRLDGPTFLRRKAADPMVADIPVIVVSATPEAVGTLHSPDVKAVLPKPMPVAVLLDEVRRWAAATGPSQPPGVH
jgi:CheY-like chemotaxis protein